MNTNNKYCENCNSIVIEKEYENNKGLIVSNKYCENCNTEKYNKYSNDTLNFTKYKKNKIIDVVNKDPDYVKYMIKNHDKYKKNGNYLKLFFVWNRNINMNNNGYANK